MTRTTAEALPLTPFGQTLHNLRQKIAHVIVTKVLQEEYDDLVEGYLDEILLAADDIVRLPAYSLVAQTYHDNLSAASAEPAARDGSNGVPWDGDDERWDRVREAWESYLNEHIDEHGRVDISEIDTAVGIALTRAFILAAGGEK